MSERHAESETWAEQFDERAYWAGEYCDRPVKRRVIVTEWCGKRHPCPDHDPALIDGTLRCGFCGQEPEAHGDSDAGPMSVCPEHNDGTKP